MINDDFFNNIEEYIKKTDIEFEILFIDSTTKDKIDLLVNNILIKYKVEKYYEDVCLLNQPFVKDSSKTIKDILTEATLKIGEKISVRRFVRYELGEGLEKRNDNLAEEVAKQMAGIK